MLVCKEKEENIVFVRTVVVEDEVQGLVELLCPRDLVPELLLESVVRIRDEDVDLLKWDGSLQDRMAGSESTWVLEEQRFDVVPSLHRNPLQVILI